MTKPAPFLVISVLLPFLTGCFHTRLQPIPAPETRSSLEIRGVVLANSPENERVEFERLDNIEWTDSTLVLTGVLKSRSTSDTFIVTTRSFPTSSLVGVLVREFDANTTSILIGGVIIGAVAVATLLLSGTANEGQAPGVTRR